MFLKYAGRRCSPDSMLGEVLSLDCGGGRFVDVQGWEGEIGMLLSVCACVVVLEGVDLLEETGPPPVKHIMCTEAALNVTRRLGE